MTLHQATAVAIGGRGLLIEGPPGTGKSSLALALIDRGAILVGDDGVELEARAGRLWAAPPPIITGMLEIRNVGFVSMPTSLCVVALVVRLDAAAPRYIETAEVSLIEGLRIPSMALWPDSPVLALRAEHALARHGLT